MNKFNTNYARGMMAEIYALIYLSMKGYCLREWRYKTHMGEIDLIMTRGKTLVFVEVKLRPSLDETVLCISPQMKNRITRAATHYTMNKKHLNEQRFDVIGISGLKIRHIKNAWLLN